MTTSPQTRYRASRTTRPRTLELVAALALLVGVAGPAFAHEEAVLKSDRSSVAAGASLPVRGSDFEKNSTVRLRLLGALDEYDLAGEVKADGEGTFTYEVTIPSAVRAGEYQVVAIASDGDVVARLDLTVLPAAAPMAGAMDEGSTAEGTMHDPEARAEEITIARDRSGIEWGVIGLVIGLAGGLGVGLIRR